MPRGGARTYAHRLRVPSGSAKNSIKFLFKNLVVHVSKWHGLFDEVIGHIGRWFPKGLDLLVHRLQHRACRRKRIRRMSCAHIA